MLGGTWQVVEQLDLQINARSVYSALRLQPSRGVNFGAIKVKNHPPKATYSRIQRHRSLYPPAFGELTRLF